MAAEIQTPVCEATGLPLPILPTEPDEQARFLFEDYHHHFHPRRDPQLMGADGLAVRFSRGQLVQRFLHDRYHAIFTGPPLPESQDEKFRLAVLACSGMVPRQAIDLSKPGQFQIVDLSHEQFERIAAPRSIYVEKAHSNNGKAYDRKRHTIGKFFAAHALSQGVQDTLSSSVIGEFLDDKTAAERKKELGNFILTQALRLSIEPIMPIHEELSAEGFVLPGRRVGPPAVVKKFFPKYRYADYHEELARRMVAAA